MHCRLGQVALAPTKRGFVRAAPLQQPADGGRWVQTGRMNTRLRRGHFFIAAALLISFGGPSVGLGSTAPLVSPPSDYGEGSSFCADAVPGGFDLGGAFDDVYACGPANNSSSQSNGFEVPAGGAYRGFFENEGWTYQCVELANRFVFDIWGLSPVYSNGNGYAQALHAAHPSVTLIANGSVG